MRTFEFDDGKSRKFWNITLQGSGFTVAFGKIGSKGRTQTKNFPDAATARRAHDKLIAEKLKQGYTETTSASPPTPVVVSPLQQSLEAALVEDPDDLATHAAYADYLHEQGDPRGEFIQVQLALEGSPPAAERARLEARERALLTAHARTWLGDVGRFLVGDWSGPDKPWHFAFRRGWLDLVRMLPFPDEVVAVLARSPEARLLRRLEIVYDMRYHPFDFHPFVEGPASALTDGEGYTDYDLEERDLMPPLLGSPYLTNLRAFKLGCSDYPGTLAHSTMIAVFNDCNAQQVIDLLAKCPRLDELYLNTDLAGLDRLVALPSLDRLRVLQYYYGTQYGNATAAYPLDSLANNASLRRLTTLRLHPGRSTTLDVADLDALLLSPNLPALEHLQFHMTDYGDEGARHIVRSGILRRLKTLDIGYGNMSDEGARLLAAAPDLTHLDVLDVSRNGLTPEGIAVLHATGIRVVADDQHGLGDNDYLYEVDVE